MNETQIKDLISFIIINSSFDQNHIDLDNEEEIVEKLYNEWLENIK